MTQNHFKRYWKQKVVYEIESYLQFNLITFWKLRVYRQ